MKIIAIIPARLASSRLPNKPLAIIEDLPMFAHVALRTAMCKQISEVWLATCDTAIFESCQKLGLKAVMTAATHQRCTERCAEALPLIEAEIGSKADLVVMVQGDEPMLRPEMLDLAIAPFRQDFGQNLQVLNLMAEIQDSQELDNPNIIKVVCDSENNALYFSRQPIPSIPKDALNFAFTRPLYKQVCLIPFRRQALLKFAQLEPRALEICESIDMLRFLEHGTNGAKVKMLLTNYPTYSVDTAEDLAKVRQLFKSDPLLASYRELSQKLK